MENATEKRQQEIIDKFQMMWGAHPSPVLLLRANREIVSVNPKGKELGIPLGIKCFQLAGREKICEGCLGNEALRDQMGKHVGSWQEKMNIFADTYWIPVQGEKEYYVHFGNDITQYVKEELCG